MPIVFPLARRALALSLLALLLLSACAGPAASDMAASGSDTSGSTEALQITLIPAPEANAGETLTVALADANGDPITDATVALEGNMNHAGMVPVTAAGATDDADGSADGHYQLPFAFTMFGDWIITVTVTQADGTTVSRNLDVQVSDGSVTGESVAHGDGMAMDDTADDAAEGDMDMGDMSDMDMNMIHIDNQRARPAPLAGGTAAVYFTVYNGTDATVALIGGETAAAAEVQIHETVDDNGVMRMRPLENGLQLEPGADAELMPGGIHVMLVDLAAPLEVGDTIDLTLHFDGADDFMLTVPVVTIEESMQGMDMGENEHGD